MSEAAVIQVRDVHLGFPLVRFRPRGVKEAFLELIKGLRHPERDRVFWAIRGVTLSVNRGEVLGLVGRNGSGKSSLLRIICGIYSPDRGEVTAQGRISSLLELGAGFRDELTGHENIRLSGAISGYAPDEIEALAEPIVAFAGLEEFIDQPLRTYSSGMRARLGFSVAAAVKPEILLIDEALAVGDASFRRRSMERIEEMVRDEDATVIIVSHNSAELLRLCTRMVLIDRGRDRRGGRPSPKSSNGTRRSLARKRLTCTCAIDRPRAGSTPRTGAGQLHRRRAHRRGQRPLRARARSSPPSNKSCRRTPLAVRPRGGGLLGNRRPLASPCGALDLGPGDVVLTTPYSFISSASVVLLVGRGARVRRHRRRLADAWIPDAVERWARGPPDPRDPNQGHPARPSVRRPRRPRSPPQAVGGAPTARTSLEDAAQADRAPCTVEGRARRHRRQAGLLLVLPDQEPRSVR